MSYYPYITLLGIVLCRDIFSYYTNIFKLVAKNYTKSSGQSYNIELYEDIIYIGKELHRTCTAKINITPLLNVFDDAFVYSNNKILVSESLGTNF